MFIMRLFSDPVFFFTVVISVGFSVCVHEFCHAYAALKCGDPTAADAGHLTLNPFKQMGVFSLIMLLLLGLCWGAVPVNNALLSRGKRIIVSLAGPLANLGMFIAGCIFCLIFIRSGVKSGVMCTVVFAQLNLVLFVLNLMPVPGFDGGNVLAQIVPMHKLNNSEVAKGFMIGMILLLFYFIDEVYKFAAESVRLVVNLLGAVLL